MFLHPCHPSYEALSIRRARGLCHGASLLRDARPARPRLALERWMSQTQPPSYNHMVTQCASEERKPCACQSAAVLRLVEVVVFCCQSASRRLSPCTVCKRPLCVQARALRCSARTCTQRCRRSTRPRPSRRQARPPAQSTPFRALSATCRSLGRSGSGAARQGCKLGDARSLGLGGNGVAEQRVPQSERGRPYSKLALQGSHVGGEGSCRVLCAWEVVPRKGQ